MDVFIGCGSRKQIRSVFINESRKMADYLANLGFDLICGGTDGLMQVCEEAFLNKGRKVSIMAVSKYYSVNEENVYVSDWNSIAERKNAIMNKTSLLVFLPGGLGTLDEIFSAIESKRAKEHDKTIVIVNIDGYYDNLLSQLNHMCEENFGNDSDKQFYYVASNVDEAIKYIEEMGIINEGKNRNIN